jgi:hypothetical protein
MAEPYLNGGELDLAEQAGDVHLLARREAPEVLDLVEEPSDPPSFRIVESNLPEKGPR